MDVGIVFTSFLMAYLIRFNFNYFEIDPYEVRIHALTITSIYLISFLITSSYSGILRHTGISDVIRILKSGVISLSVLIVINLAIGFNGAGSIFYVSYSIIILHFLLSIFWLVGTRVFIKLAYLELTKQYATESIPVIIYGAGSAGLLTKNALVKDRSARYNIVAFIDDNPSKISKRIEGVPVLNQYRALRNSYINRHEVKQLIIAIDAITPEKKKKIIEAGLDLNLDVKVIPPIGNWINGQLSSKQLRRVKIEELLERDTIKLDNKNIEREISNKIVMVTGAAGSIGAEISRQVLNYSPKRLIIIDQAETPTFDLQFEIHNSKEFSQYQNKIEFIVASVKDKFRMDKIISLYRPDIIYHAAAYKHVPLMEDNPYEALMVNIFGTKTMADLAKKYEVEKFVMVSTDKAVNPTNIMGASKRIAEIYIQSLSNGKTKFITTRFGNVLGSNGSVVPIFRKQIDQGGPVTITHKEITRYFMTIREACNLVLEAGAMGNGSDIFVFDMGQPVKIYDMAKKMIKLLGYSEGQIEINEIGLRPGEKLYEELLNNSENTLPTHHPKILRAEVNALTNNQINNYLVDLSSLIVESNEYSLVSKMKEIVPEFVSNNSVYEKLDVKKR
jgi:FlaA1/EpsC-like NDP-sugar epimerase